MQKKDNAYNRNPLFHRKNCEKINKFAAFDN